MLRDVYEELSASGLQVAGVSPQAPERHKSFAAEYKLPFTLIADPEKAAIKAYGADGPFGIGVRRITYLIGPEGVIRDAVKADLRLSYHEAFVQKALAEAREAVKGPPR
jgi:peroxiredoxin Q/BCP